VLTAAVANGGTVFVPRLVDRVEPQESFDHQPSRLFSPGRIRAHAGISARSLALVRDAMLADVEDPDGTGHKHFHQGRGGPPLLPNFRVCGKTGTAQVMKGHTVIDHITWFVSFAPYESPRYAVVVMVESGGSGGGTCAPVACEIYQALQQREKAGFLAGPPAMAMQ
jgi:penicillin-binding protein 2